MFCSAAIMSDTPPAWLQDLEQPDFHLGLYLSSEPDDPSPMDIDGEMDELINKFASISLNDEPPVLLSSSPSDVKPMYFEWASPMSWEHPPAFQMDWEPLYTL